jgi:hypothetical protein
MTQARYGGQGRFDRRGDREGPSCASKGGRGNGYSTTPKSIKSGPCKELETMYLNTVAMVRQTRCAWRSQWIKSNSLLVYSMARKI